MSDDAKHRRFELLVLPHLDAALNLARWLTHNDQDAQDVVQEACVRAIRFVHGFRGDNARPWLLQIVRNTCFSWLKENRPTEILLCDDTDDILSGVAAPATDEPAAMAMQNVDRLQINSAIAALSATYREVLVLRELNNLSYKDIAQIVNIPVGTVMSRLARARGLLQQALLAGSPRNAKHVPAVAAE